MGWLMKNGSYPYLDGVPAPMEVLTPPYPVSIWICNANSSPTCRLIPENVPLGCFANAANLRTMRYAGTMAQWQKIRLGTQWRANAPFDRVICKDGEIVFTR